MLRVKHINFTVVQLAKKTLKRIDLYPVVGVITSLSADTRTQPSTAGNWARFDES